MDGFLAILLNTLLMSIAVATVLWVVRKYKEREMWSPKQLVLLFGLLLVGCSCVLAAMFRALASVFLCASPALGVISNIMRMTIDQSLLFFLFLKTQAVGETVRASSVQDNMREVTLKQLVCLSLYLWVSGNVACQIQTWVLPEFPGDGINLAQAGLATLGFVIWALRNLHMLKSKTVGLQKELKLNKSEKDPVVLVIEKLQKSAVVVALLGTMVFGLGVVNLVGDQDGNNSVERLMNISCYDQWTLVDFVRIFGLVTSIWTDYKAKKKQKKVFKESTMSQASSKAGPSSAWGSSQASSKSSKASSSVSSVAPTEV